MKFKLGAILGFAVGYYLGSMAGRERYQQLNRLLRKARKSDAIETVVDKTKAVVDLGVERAKDIVDHRTNGASGPIAADGTVPITRPL
jgi:hypothetical protein